MHATSLQTLVILVAQAAPGGDFQPTKKQIEIPNLLAPRVKSTATEPPSNGPKEAKIREDELATDPPVKPSPPEDKGSQAAPPDFVPPINKQEPIPAYELSSPLEIEPDTKPSSIVPQSNTGGNLPVEFRAAGQLETSGSPLPHNPARTLAVGPNRNPWEVTKTLIKEAATPTANTPTLTGRKISLRQALARVSNRDERIAVIKTYWRLSVAAADLNHAHDEVQQLASFPDPLSELDGAQLSAAVVSAAARLSETKLVLLSTQHELVQLMKSGSSELPLTSDIPFVGSYEPKFNEIFAGRTAPADLRRLADSFPLYLELCNARARSVLGAEATLKQLADAYPRGNVAFAQILDAFRNLREQRIAFLATVRDYNSAIADYSLNTINVGLNTDAVVATLIETEPVPSVLASPSGVRPASGVEPVRTAGQPTPVAQPPQTPASAGRLVPVRQPSEQFVPRQVTPAAPTQQTPLSPIADPATSGGFRR